MDIILLSLLFGIAVVLVAVNVFAAKEGLNNITQKRLFKIKNRVFETSNGQQEKVKRNFKVLMQDTEYKVRLLGEILNKVAVVEQLKKTLKMADEEIKVDVFIIISLLTGFPFYIMALLFLDKFAIFVVIGLVVNFIPFIMLKRKIKKRLAVFTQLFPDTLGLISSSLRAGHSLSAAFQVVSSEMPSPINKIFRTVVDDISLGRDTRDALDNMTKAMPDSIDLRFFVTAVLIQREIGGNLAEILDSLSHTIRERFKLLGQLNAQTSQAKMSGLILSIAPVAIGFLIWLMNPKYMEPLFVNTMGKMALGGAFVSAIVGYLVIMKITDIKV